MRSKSKTHPPVRRTRRARIGRFITPDPIDEAGGVNLYAYALNDPINGHDYLGMSVMFEDQLDIVGGGDTGAGSDLSMDDVVGGPSDEGSFTFTPGSGNGGSGSIGGGPDFWTFVGMAGASSSSGGGSSSQGFDMTSGFVAGSSGLGAGMSSSVLGGFNPATSNDLDPLTLALVGPGAIPILPKATGAAVSAAAGSSAAVPAMVGSGVAVGGAGLVALGTAGAVLTDMSLMPARVELTGRPAPLHLQMLLGTLQIRQPRLGPEGMLGESGTFGGLRQRQERKEAVIGMDMLRVNNFVRRHPHVEKIDMMSPELWNADIDIPDGASFRQIDRAMSVYWVQLKKSQGYLFHDIGYDPDATEEQKKESIYTPEKAALIGYPFIIIHNPEDY